MVARPSVNTVHVSGLHVLLAQPLLLSRLGLLRRGGRGPEARLREASAGHGDGRLPSCHAQAVSDSHRR